MFDIGFWELAIIGVVALLVFGPERLPELARTAGRWIARARQMAWSVKNEIERELDLEELRRLERRVDVPRLEDWLEDAERPRPTMAGARERADAPAEPAARDAQAPDAGESQR